MRLISESYSVKHGHEQTGKPFDTLDAAVAYINNGMKNREQDHYVLFDETGKEMIWIDWYTYDDKHTAFPFSCYTVSRQNDKKTIKFDDKKRQLSVNDQKEDAADLRGMVIVECGRMKLFNVANKLKNMRFVLDKSKPSWIDFEDNCVHYNTNEQLNDAIRSLEKQLQSKTESAHLSERYPIPDELRPYNPVYNAPESRVEKETVLTGSIKTIVDTLKPIYLKARKKKFNTASTKVSSSVGTYTLALSNEPSIRIILPVQGGYSLILKVDSNYRDWEDRLLHLASITPKPDIPLILETSRRPYALKGFYTQNEHNLTMKDYGKELETIVTLLKSSDINTAAEKIFNNALAENWLEELNKINN
jgi:hypothetical protein